MHPIEYTRRLPKIIVKFDNLHYYPSELIIEGLELIELALHDIEANAIEEAFKQYELNDLLYSAKVEMAKMRRRHLQVYAAKSGSIEFWGVGGVVALWVLQITLGESMKEAYKKSDIHRKLSSVFSADVNEFAERLSKNIKQQLYKAKRNSALVVALSRVDVTTSATGDREVVVNLSANANYESIPIDILEPRRPY